MSKSAKRKIKLNQLGNWNGYISGRRFVEFGLDDIAAGHWLLTGDTTANSGYESEQTIKAARAALGRDHAR